MSSVAPAPVQLSSILPRPSIFIFFFFFFFFFTLQHILLHALPAAIL